MSKEAEVEIYKQDITAEMRGRNTWEKGITWSELCQNRDLSKSKAKEALRKMRKDDDNCVTYAIKGHSEQTGWEWRLVNLSEPSQFDQVETYYDQLTSYMINAKAQLRRKRQVFEQLHPELASQEQETSS